MTNDMLHRLLAQRVVAAQRQIAADEAGEMSPVRVNAALRALGEKTGALEARLAAFEAGRG